MTVLKSKAAITQRFGISVVKTGTIWYVDVYFGKNTYMLIP